MAFVIFLQCFEETKPSGVPREWLREAFRPFLKESEPDFWDLRYDAQNFCRVLLVPLANDTIHQLALDHPCQDIRLWDSLAKLLSIGNLIAYFPGGSGPLLYHEGVARHIPADMLQSLGKPVLARTGSEIRRCVETA
jgi:hypothetical protein